VRSAYKTKIKRLIKPNAVAEENWCYFYIKKYIIGTSTM